MPYPAIPSRRIPYDIDGTIIGQNGTTDYAGGIASYWTSSGLINLNSEDLSSAIHVGYTVVRRSLWFFFPEKREITHHFMQASHSYVTVYEIQGSNDTTNGIDGTWETAIGTTCQYSNSNSTLWRSNIIPLSFSEPKKVLRTRMQLSTSERDFYCIHLYGMKYAPETPDDILFVDDSTGDELTSLIDWSDRPEGTTVFKQIKVKNASTTKTANNVNLQLNHNDFLISWNAGGPWTSVLDITSLGAGAESATIYLKNELRPPNLALGPKAARLIATVGSWT